MKVTIGPTPAHDLALTAHPGEYDAAPPVASLLLDHQPQALHPDRVALAAHLAFGRSTSGVLELPTPCSPAMAAAIRRDSDGVVDAVQPVELYPKGLPAGSVTAHLTDTLDGFSDPRRAGIAVLPSHAFNGALRTLTSVAVASNAFLLARDEHDARPALAVAVLLAEDAAVDALVLDVPEDEETARLAALLGAARLGLVTRAD